MSPSIAVIGAGPGVGRAVADRWAREGYAVALVARRREPLDRMATELADAGATAHAVPGDLAGPADVGELAERVRRAVGDPDVLYVGATGGRGDPGFLPAATARPDQLSRFVPSALESVVALVQEFLPTMLARGGGAILSAQGASAVRGMAGLSGPGPAQAAQRNYLQSLHAEVAGQGVYVGALYIGAAIRHTPFHDAWQSARDAGQGWGMPEVDPADLADQLWAMPQAGDRFEVWHPANMFDS